MRIKLVDSFYYRIQNEDNLNLLCRRFNTDKTSIKRNNKDLKLYSGEWVKIDVNDFKSHFVLPAETLDAISKKYNIKKEKLILDNDLKTERLYIGQRIKIYDEALKD